MLSKVEKSWRLENIRDIQIKYILFLLSPFFAFLYALNRVNTKSSYIIFFLFAVFFGLAFTVGTQRTEGSIDGIFYRNNFEWSQGITSQSYADGLEDFLRFEGKKDYYADTLNYFLSRITNNYHIMFMVAAIVFSFFSLKSFRYLTSEQNFNGSLICLILSFLFMYNIIFNINGMRFWTAAWVAVFCVFKIIKEHKYRYILLALATTFFHGAYWVFVVLLLIVLLFRRFEKLWIVAFFCSFLLSNLFLAYAQEFSAYLPSALAGVVRSYTNIRYVVEVNEADTGFITKFFGYVVDIFLVVLVCIFIKERRLIKSNSKIKDLYLFLLIWMSFCFAGMSIPSLGSRYIILSYPFIAYIWLVAFGTHKYKKVIYFLPLVFLADIYRMLALCKMVSGFSFYVSSPFYLIYKYLC